MVSLAVVFAVLGDPFPGRSRDPYLNHQVKYYVRDPRDLLAGQRSPDRLRNRVGKGPETPFFALFSAKTKGIKIPKEGPESPDSGLFNDIFKIQVHVALN